MKLQLLGLVLLLVVAGCSRKVVSTTTAKVTDSVRVQFVPRLVEVQVPGETVTLTRYLDCDSVTNKPKPAEFEVRGSKAKIKIKVTDTGELVATGGCDSLKTVVEAMDKELFHYRHESKTESKATEVYLTRPIDKALRWIVGAELVLLIAYVFYKLNRIQP